MTKMKTKANILVVDDEPEIRELLKEFLELKGYAVITAADGAGALSCVNDQQLDLALIDMSMPGMDGLELLRSLHTLTPSVGVIMLTGLCDDVVARQALQSGAREFLIKPLNLRHLEHAIRAALPVTHADSCDR